MALSSPVEHSLESLPDNDKPSVRSNGRSVPTVKEFSRSWQLAPRLPHAPQTYQLFFDVVAFLLSFVAYRFVRFQSGIFSSSTHQALPSNAEGWIALASVAAALYVYWALVFWFSGLYENWYVRSPFDECFKVLRTTFVGCCILGVAIFLEDVGATAHGSRLLVLLYWAELSVCVCAGRIVARLLQRSLRIRGVIQLPVVLVGDADSITDLLAKLRAAPEFGYQPLGVILRSEADVARWQSLHHSLAQHLQHYQIQHQVQHQVHHQVQTQQEVQSGTQVQRLQAQHLTESGAESTTTTLAVPPCLGVVSQVRELLALTKPQEVIMSMKAPDHEETLRIGTECDERGIRMKIVPDLYEIFSGQARASRMYGMPFIEVSQQLMRPWEEVLKRLMDIVFSVVVLVVGMPLWLLVALAVKIESEGPALYSQVRVGRHGKLFRIYKFRSMRIDAEKEGPKWATKNDSRVTRVGKFIRKTHLDEIPQCWNILRGDMSLVGPRPEVPFFVEKYSSMIPYLSRRLKVRPGLTGWYQVNFVEHQETLEYVQERLRYDFFYIENMSFKLDVEIILRTVVRVLRGSGTA
jgi:lipopolysaccharide/colanic/teichoic acid biosynthesis glycosyltransferase